MISFDGLSAFPITPSDAGGTIDADVLRRLVRRLCEAKVDSIGLLGSTGTYAYLTRSERRRALDAALDEAGAATPILVGVGALRTDDAVLLAQDAKAAGAAAGLLAPVSYTPLTDDEVFEHFVAVAGESGLPLCVYDNPTTTHFKFSPGLIGRLSRVPGVLAVKSPAPDPGGLQRQLPELRGEVREGFSLGYSTDWNAVEALLAGGMAWYSVAGGLFPTTCMAIVRAIRGGDADEARRLDATLQPLWRLFRAYSSLRVAYSVMDLLGLWEGAPPRPLLPLAPTVRHEIAETIGAMALS